jgi:hypothetical protein
MSTRLVGSLILGWACLALLASQSHARQIEDWPYDKLFKHSELVVIVRPLSVRDATAKDKAVPPGNRDYLVGVVTNFKILHVVKGTYKAENLDLVHFKLKEGAQILNGPLLVSFHTKRFTLMMKSGFAVYDNNYMLFLKPGKDKRLEFVSGQFDPELSVKQLLGPLP